MIYWVKSGLKSLIFFFEQRTRQEPSTTTLLRIAGQALNRNTISFDDEHCKQIGHVSQAQRVQITLVYLLVMSRNRS